MILAGTLTPDTRAPLHRALAETRRVGMGVAGPAGMAAVQFVATMALWGRVPATQFGLFSFATVLLQLSYGVSNALVGTPLSLGAADGTAHRRRCLSANAVHVLLAGLVIGGTLAMAGAGRSSFAFAAMAVAGNLRWAARAMALAAERVRWSAASDAVYALALGAALALLLIARRLDIATLAWAMTGANLVALGGGGAFRRAQWAAVWGPDLAGYIRYVWRRQAGWALGGVATTELASNAQSYAVTGLHGAAAFAPLAFGALFCRPLTIFLTALTQVDRPIFARHRAAGDGGRAKSLLRAALAAAVVTWLANLLLALAVLQLAAGSIAARGYDPVQMRWIVLLWFAVMLLRALRNPFSTALQASGAFRALAACSAAAGVVSVVGAGSLALVAPLWSLGGTLLGEAVLLGAILHLHRRTR